jgi:hypothetical protein
MKGIRQHAELVVVVVTLAIFGGTVFFDRHTGAQNNPAPETGFQGGIELINRTSVNQLRSNPVQPSQATERRVRGSTTRAC